MPVPDRSVSSVRDDPTPSHSELVDDHEDDGLWALDHSTRRYRVRPLRNTDKAPYARGRPGVVVIDTQSLERLVVPAVGWVWAPADTDAWGAMIFAARDAYNAGNAS